MPPERPDIVRWGDVPMGMTSVVGSFERSAFNVVYTAMPEAHYALAGRFVEPAVGPDFTTCVQPRTTANWPGAARSGSRAKPAFYRRVSWQI